MSFQAAVASVRAHGPSSPGFMPVCGVFIFCHPNEVNPIATKVIAGNLGRKVVVPCSVFICYSSPSRESQGRSLEAETEAETPGSCPLYGLWKHLERLTNFVFHVFNHIMFLGT